MDISLPGRYNKGRMNGKDGLGMDNKTLYADIGMRIRAFRKNRGMTLSELARILNKSVPTVSKYESGEVAIGIDVLLDICSCFDIAPGALLPDTSSDPESEDTSRYGKYYEELLWLYWYNGEQNCVRSALIDNRNSSMTRSTLYFDIDSAEDLAHASFIYDGEISYSDTGTVFLYSNTIPPFDKLVLRIPSFTRNQPFRVGMFITMNYYYQNVAVKAVVASAPVHDGNTLLPKLKLTNEELREIRRTNFFIF